MAPCLILTGFMGTGKSSIAPILARKLAWTYIDSDEVLVARAGKPIAAIFESEGEAHFRSLEREVIAHISHNRPLCPLSGRALPAVIATGGGVLMDEANYQALNHAGVIICLSARPEVIARRVERTKARRPKLLEGGKPLRERIAELLAQRKVAYSRAEAVVDTSDLSVERAAERVLAAFIEHGARRCAPSA
ncbi:MAG TPA: shikimate kinase [Candidatus Binataceae bacterium]|nr:shikimate kinase [Candidatus Binataceae bacterium]